MPGRNHLRRSAVALQLIVAARRAPQDQSLRLKSVKVPPDQLDALVAPIALYPTTCSARRWSLPPIRGDYSASAVAG